MDRLEAMSVFAAIVDGGSLSAAGRRLNVPLATVSRKLADLEAHLKTRLITRSTRKLVLTDAGRDYLGACRQILEQVDEAELAALAEQQAQRERAFDIRFLCQQHALDVGVFDDADLGLRGVLAGRADYN